MKGYKCDCCKKVINYGDECITDKMYVGIFCSPSCWAKSMGSFCRAVLDEEVIDNSGRNNYQFGENETSEEFEIS